MMKKVYLFMREREREVYKREFLHQLMMVIIQTNMTSENMWNNFPFHLTHSFTYCVAFCIEVFLNKKETTSNPH